MEDKKQSAFDDYIAAGKEYIAQGSEYIGKTVDCFNSKIEVYKEKYNPVDLMKKIADMGKKAGVSTVYYALLLYYGLMNDSIPASKRILAVAALGYFISPLDFIPDFIIGGLLDDSSALIYAVSNIISYIDDKVELQAKSKLHDWFGEQEIITIDFSKLTLFPLKSEKPVPNKISLPRVIEDT